MEERERPTLEELANRARGGVGLRCPKCHAQNFVVFKTRPGADQTIRRQRVCRVCGHRFMTSERVIGEPREK